MISVATTELFAGLQKMDRSQEEASLDLGATPWQTFWRITFPGLRLSLIAAGLLIFTLSPSCTPAHAVRSRQYSSFRNLRPAPAWHHPGNQRDFHPHLCRFRRLNCRLVSTPDSHRRLASAGTSRAYVGLLEDSTLCRKHAVTSSNFSLRVLSLPAAPSIGLSLRNQPARRLIPSSKEIISKLVMSFATAIPFPSRNLPAKSMC